MMVLRYFDQAWSRQTPLRRNPPLATGASTQAVSMYPQPFSLSHCSAEVMAMTSSRPYLRIEGVSEMRRRVASALEVRVSEVTVEHYRYSPLGLLLQCVGSVREKRFFAKVFLADPYPVPDRFCAPWEEPFVLDNRSRPVEDQIAAEWEMTIKMRALVGNETVPAPLGRSSADQTIVWEEIRGTAMDKAAQRVGNLTLRAETISTVLFHSARWLRRLHDASCQGTQTIDVSKALARLEQKYDECEPAFREYMAMAAEALRSSIRATGKSTFATPVTMTHGDYCLSNLIWRRRQNRVAVVDFELSWIRPACHDLFSFISDLRGRLLNPMTPKDTIATWERAFWNGYGPVSPDLPIFVSAFAHSRIFYRRFPRLLTRHKRMGWLAGVNASFYRAIFERHVITHRLNVTPQPSLPDGFDTSITSDPVGEIEADSKSKDRRDAVDGL